LFNVVEKSGNYVFKDDNLRAKFVSYSLGAYKVFIESVAVETSINQ
jgi:hypothetical protein